MKKLKKFSIKEILFAYLFGSFIDEEISNDIDIGIYLNDILVNPKDIFYTIDLSIQIEKIVGKSVEVITMNNSPNYILYRIFQGKLIKNTDDNLRVNFITSNLKKYFDFRILLKEHIEERKNASG